jgi:hypothetical protein
MSAARTPPYRSLDIYRLVVARRLKQQDVAKSFGVAPPRICEIVRRVREWVDVSLGDWLFPRRHDLRFYAALACARIRPYEVDDDAEAIVLVGPGWSYCRRDGHAAEASAAEADLITQQALSAPDTVATEVAPKVDANLSPQPLNPFINSEAADRDDPPATTSCGGDDSASPTTLELAQRLAQLLILWRKSRKL